MPPLTFSPLVKQIRWGGRRLGTVLGKPIGEADDYAESWEVVDHGDDQSVVAGGPHAGKTLSDVVRSSGDDLFGPGGSRDQFPLLIKFLDASDRLSVQVHPDDALAKRHDPRELGKTEAWVILDATPEAKLWCGLQPDVTETDVRRSLADDTMEDVLHAVPVTAGDCVFIPAGTVHAIGEGVLLAEVQQSSDLTFRYYDWGRVGADGQPRQLHIEDSIEATDFDRGPVEPVQPQLIDASIAGQSREHLVSCEFFQMTRRHAPAGFEFPDDGELRVVMTMGGTGTLQADGIDDVPLTTGQTVLLPAVRGAVRIEVEQPLTLLETTLA